MNAFAPAGYSQLASPMNDSRNAEATILRSITAEMVLAMKPGMPFQNLIMSVSKNRQFWQHIAFDLADDGNGLPDQTRAALISIAGFVDRHCSAVLSGTTSPEPLIDINRSIISGLLGRKK